ncbi:sensor histidine kinase [Virgibacillus soli]
MRLRSQLTVAFSTLLIVIMTVTGYVIYSLILNLLIQNEQRQLEQKGEILVNVLNEQYESHVEAQGFNQFLKEQELQLILYEGKTNSVLYSTMSNQVVHGLYQQNKFSNRSKELWEYGNDKFVTSRILFYPEDIGLELILLTPLKDLQAVQHTFFMRLLLVFFIGIVITVLLSYFLTNKLVTPLTRLKHQLKNIEQRKFKDIQPIQATGEIKEVAQSVYDMANELQRYINSQQTFFQNASHELKTPLMTIQGYAEGIKEHVFDEAEEEKGLEVMVHEVNRLKKIINEMILLAKLESEKQIYRKSNVDITYLLQQIKERVLPIVTEKQIAFHYESEPLMLVVDEEKLLRALLNLTFNAIRHANTTVVLKAWKHNSELYLTVEDDGEGIEDELMPHIFHRFVKGKNGETGLGLAIARAIVEQSNGKITVGRSPLGGAMFTIVFQI